MAQKSKKKSKGNTSKKGSKTRLKSAVVSQLFDLAREMRTSLSTKLLDLDIYGGQERIILFLKDKDGQAPGAIASELGVSAPTIAKSITRLAARGIVVRRTDKTDRRKATIHLTNLGHSMVKSIQKEQKKWRDKVMNGVQKSEMEEIIKQVEFIRKNLTKID